MSVLTAAVDSLHYTYGTQIKKMGELKVLILRY